MKKIAIVVVMFVSHMSVMAGDRDSAATPAAVRDSMRCTTIIDSLSVTPTDYPVCSFTPAPELSATRLGIIGGALSATVFMINYYQRNAWWLGERAPFHFQNDWDYALNVDKVGHIYATALTQHVFQKSLEWTGLSETKSVWYGAGLALLFELYIETQDGFHKEWGFSPGDAMGDAIGAAYPVLQHYVPPLQKVKFRWSYWPSQDFRDGKKQMIIDDYQGQAYWLSVSFYDWLPESMQSWWPSFLGVAIGYATRNLDGMGGGDEQFYIAFDYDFTKLPGDSWILKTLKETGNFFHLPAPGIRITPTGTYFMLYY